MASPRIKPLRKIRTTFAHYDTLIKPADREHWAYQRLRPPAVLRVKATDWVRNPIDHFVRVKLEAEGWKPSSPAEPRAAAAHL